MEDRRSRPDRAVSNEDDKRINIVIAKCFLGGYRAKKKKKKKKRERKRRKVEPEPEEWKGFCKSETVAKAIDRCVQYVSHVTAMASRLLNYHVLRCLESGTVIESKSSSVYNKILSKIFIAASNIVKKEQPFHPNDAIINASAIAFNSLLQSNGQLEFPVYETWMYQVMLCSSKEFATNVTNHLFLNLPGFTKRVFKAAIKLEYPWSELSQGKRPVSLAAAAYQSLVDHKPLCDVIKAFPTLQETATEAEIAFIQSIINDLEPTFPRAKSSDHTWFWERVVYFKTILCRLEGYKITVKEMNEEIAEGERMKKFGRLTFNLLPLTKMRAKYITLASSHIQTLIDAIAREPPKKSKKVDRIVHYDTSDRIKFQAIKAKIDGEPDEGVKKRIAWSECFDVKRFERIKSGLTFYGSISTDGIGVSVRLKRLKTGLELEIIELTEAVAESKKNHREENERRKARGEPEKKWIKTEEEKRLDEMKEEKRNQTLNRARDLLGFHKDGDGIWRLKEGALPPRGLDPGKKKPFTSVEWSAGAEVALRHKDPNKNTFGKPSEENEHFESAEMTKSRYYHLCGFNKRVNTVKHHVESEPVVKTYNEGAESTKTSDFQRYCIALSVWVSAYDDLMRVYSSRRWWRRIKAGTYVKKQEAIEVMISEITGQTDHKLQKNVVIGFGDASIGQTRGCAPVGNKKLRETLRHRACMIDIDEGRSSMLCCCCFNALVGLLDTLTGKRSYSVRHCQNNDCLRELFDRDINAAINILFKLLWLIRYETLPNVFERKKCKAVPGYNLTAAAEEDHPNDLHPNEVIAHLHD